MAIVELLVASALVYGVGCLWPNITLATLSFVIGMAFAQYNPAMPRIGALLHTAKLAIARLLSRSDDLGTSISDIAASTVRMTTAQAKAIIERETAAKQAPESEAAAKAIAAVTKPAAKAATKTAKAVVAAVAAAAAESTKPADPVDPAEKPADKTKSRVSFKDRLVQFEK